MLGSKGTMSDGSTGRLNAQEGGKRRIGLVKLRAHAKINLDIQVGARRADGFHDLCTIMQSIDLHDTLTLRITEGPCQIRCSATGVPQDENNLVWQAVRALWTALERPGEPRGVTVTIGKSVPVAAGLGGGTSDAVAVLRGMCRLWGVAAESSCLASIAAELGADGPFFLVGGTALGIGKGEDVYPLVELPRYWVVIAAPPRGVMTAAAYRWLALDRSVPFRKGDSRDRQERRPPPLIGASIDFDALKNDLEQPVSRRRPEIREAVQLLADAGAQVAAMTGSGSAVFALFSSREPAAQAARCVRFNGWKVTVTQTIDRVTLARRIWL